MLRRSRSSEPPGHRSGVATSGVVVAGDDPDALELMGRLLTPLGEPVSLIGDTASAVAAVAASPCRVLVLAFHGEAYARYRARVPGLIPWPGRSLDADEARALCALRRHQDDTTSTHGGS